MRRFCFMAALLVTGAAFAQTPLAPAAAPAGANIRDYIANGWQTLSRSMNECKSVVDPKVTTTPILYLPAGMATPASVVAMQKECHVEVKSLPHAVKQIGDLRPRELPKEGLLYLPNKYVVPGGRFNEMYGWDSYFIILGLVHDKQMDLARGQVENFFFEIENYGAILNANRTYFFTRSQPPFLSSMIREVYEAPGAAQDLKWLAHAYEMARRDYALWTSPIHQAGNTGLARYRDLGEGPVPEMADDSAYYPDVIRYLIAHPSEHSEANPDYLVADSSDSATVARTSCDTQVSKVCAGAVVDGKRLSADFFRGDRAMRESGFDTTFRFGTFAGSTDHYAPVCLNALLYKYEMDMAHFATLLKRPSEATAWKIKAQLRHDAIDQYLWNPATGMYMDYDFVAEKRSTYHYVTTFYPLWAGLASTVQANAVRGHLSYFERPGGLAMSDTTSGVQWDQPYGWAPTNWLAADGLERYGFHADATRIAKEFMGTVEENFKRDGTIREKYNVVSGSANVAVATGYKANVVGFGWTNGVYLKLGDLVGGR